MAETDPRGYKTYYGVHSSSSQAVLVTNRYGVSTRYTFNICGKIDAMIAENPESELSDLADLGFYYNARGNLASINRGNGQSSIEYTLNYDRFCMLSSVGITGYGSLVDITYNDSDRPKKTPIPETGR